MISRLGLLGDVHAEDGFLAAALGRLARERLDAIVCTGDLVDGRGDVDRCVGLLERHRVIAVAGNHERWIVHHQMRDLPGATDLDGLADATRWYIAHLPRLRRLETVAGPLLLCHGLGNDDMIFVYPDGAALRRDVVPGRTRLRARGQLGIDPDIRLLVGGHTHVRWVGAFGRLTILNPGTLRASDAPGFAVADLGEGAVQWLDLDEDGRVMEGMREAIARPGG